MRKNYSMRFHCCSFCFLNLWLNKALRRCQNIIVKFRHLLCLYLYYLNWKKVVFRKCMFEFVCFCVWVCKNPKISLRYIPLYEPRAEIFVSIWRVTSLTFGSACIFSARLKSLSAPGPYTTYLCCFVALSTAIANFALFYFRKKTFNHFSAYCLW